MSGEKWAKPKEIKPKIKVKVFFFLKFLIISFEKIVEAVRSKEFAEERRAERMDKIKIKLKVFGKEKI